MSSADTEVKTVENKEAVPQHPAHPQQQDSHDEEYESADDAYEEEEIEVEEEVDEEEEELEDEERSASQQEREKELDDDEDVKNPQFIPKRGYFYEHDDRTKTEDESEEPVEPKKEEAVKKPPAKEPERWSHDMFQEEDQAPKSKEELSKAYGYDIWSEDQAPRARRRRRYGRGPNKYTRKWEEEEAYQKPRGGFRGRGSRGRGNFRGSNTRGGEDEHVEEEFPALPELEHKTRSSQQSQQQAPKPPVKDQPSERRAGGDYPARNQYSGSENRRRSDYDERNSGPRGGGGRGGPRGRGRRNEFSNRNRYPKRDDDDGPQRQQEESPGQGQGAERERPSNRPRPPQAKSQGYSENRERDRDNRNRTSHQQTNGHVRDNREPRSKDNPLSSKPPFTNTEYTGSHSLTANRGRHQQNQVQHQQEDHGRQIPSQTLAEKGFVTDLRDVINAKRQAQQQQQQHSQGDRPERRQQMPPRLQQQQQQHQNLQHQQQPPVPQHHHHQQQQHLPQSQHPNQVQQQQHQQMETQSSSKSKRYSAQRQRQTEQTMASGNISQSGNGGGPMVGHPNMIPVVTGSEQMVQSPVPSFPQPPSYYEGPQVYETSGTPVTVAPVATNGTSVSPSLWAPHAYANAPYPSPPTGPQVPPAAYADHAAFLAAQQAGPIYSAPPPFIQDPAMLNYNAAAPFAPTFHPQGFQGYPQVTPAPPPELYHAGITYYNPQPQIQRQPMMAPKRTKTVLQLVEPPEKVRNERSSQLKDLVNQEHHSQSQSPPTYAASDLNVHGHVEQSDLVQQFENVSIVESQPQLQVEEPLEQIRKPSPIPEQESWSAQMEEINSPINESPPEMNFQANTSPTHQVIPPKDVETDSLELACPETENSDRPSQAVSVKEEVKVESDEGADKSSTEK